MIGRLAVCRYMPYGQVCDGTVKVSRNGIAHSRRGQLPPLLFKGETHGATSQLQLRITNKVGGHADRLTAGHDDASIAPRNRAPALLGMRTQ